MVQSYLDPNPRLSDPLVPETVPVHRNYSWNNELLPSVDCNLAHGIVS